MIILAQERLYSSRWFTCDGSKALSQNKSTTCLHAPGKLPFGGIAALFQGRWDSRHVHAALKPFRSFDSGSIHFDWDPLQS